MNKDYLLTKGIDDKVRFVTGTDCHDWSVYPKEDPSDTNFHMNRRYKIRFIHP